MSNSSNDLREQMNTRIRWATDMATNAYIKTGVPDVDLPAVKRLLHEADMCLQAAQELADQYEEALEAEYAE